MARQMDETQLRPGGGGRVDQRARSIRRVHEKAVGGLPWVGFAVAGLLAAVLIFEIMR